MIDEMGWAGDEARSADIQELSVHVRQVDESIGRVEAAVKMFDAGSGRLSRRMIFLSWVIVALTVVMLIVQLPTAVGLFNGASGPSVAQRHDTTQYQLSSSSDGRLYRINVVTGEVMLVTPDGMRTVPVLIGEEKQIGRFKVQEVAP